MRIFFNQPTRLARDKALDWFVGVDNFKTFHRSTPSADYNFDEVFE